MHTHAFPLPPTFSLKLTGHNDNGSIQICPGFALDRQAATELQGTDTSIITLLAVKNLQFSSGHFIVETKQTSNSRIKITVSQQKK